MTSLKLRTRRCRAQAAIEAYCQAVCYRPDNGEALIDLLTDLRHWAGAHGLDFEQAIDHSHFHYSAEVQP